jgi:hypothetical protein
VSGRIPYQVVDFGGQLGDNADERRNWLDRLGSGG